MYNSFQRLRWLLCKNSLDNAVPRVKFIDLFACQSWASFQQNKHARVYTLPIKSAGLFCVYHDYENIDLQTAPQTAQKDFFDWINIKFNTSRVNK